jgi:hypothetical protein
LIAGSVVLFYLVSGNVCLHFRAWHPHAEYEDPYLLVESRSSDIDVIINDQQRSGDILWLSRVRWVRNTDARNDIDSIAANRALDFARGDYQSADRIHKNRVPRRADKAQSLNCDAGSRRFDIKRSRSSLNTRHLIVAILRARDRDCLRQQDRG